MDPSKFELNFRMSFDDEEDELNEVLDLDADELLDIYKKTINNNKCYDSGPYLMYLMLYEDIAALSNNTKNCILFMGFSSLMQTIEEAQKEIIHEAMLELYSPSEYNPITKTYQPKRTKRMSTKEMAHMIYHVFNHLASMDIPSPLRDIADGDMTDLFKKWYEWRNSQNVEMFIDKDMTWTQYKKMQKVCEFTFTHEGDSVHLEQMHIISRGADKSIIDEPWNWIRGRSDIHRLQHQHGWPYIINLYPHIKEKIEKAVIINASRKNRCHED